MKPVGNDGEEALRWVNRLVAQHLLAETHGRRPSEVEIDNQVRERPSFRNIDEIYSITMQLSEREAGILRLRAGLIGEPRRSASETASVYGVSDTRISQIEKRLAAKLAAHSRSTIYPDDAGPVVNPDDDYR